MLSWISKFLGIADLKTVKEFSKIYNHVFIDVRPVFFADEEKNWHVISKKASDLILMIDLFINEGKTVIIYCRGGIDRSPFIAALYLNKNLYYTPELAYKRIKKEHPPTMEHMNWFEEMGLIKWY